MKNLFVPRPTLAAVALTLAGALAVGAPASAQAQGMGMMQPTPPAATGPQTPDAIEQAMLGGMAYAKAQLAAGRLETMRLGPPPSPQENAHIAAIERQGVMVVQLGDVISAGLVAYADANNALMDAAIRQKYGNDFWDRIDQQAPMGMPSQ